MSDPFNIVFMGTPAFAVPALKALARSRHRVSLVVTQPDRPGGRGRKVIPPAVKEAAVNLGLPVIQPESIKTDDVLAEIAARRPDLFVVVAFGRLLPKKLLDLPARGAVNIHASLLPAYRGPAPIQWAIINGDNQTGVTTMFMDEGLDTGNILLSAKTDIQPEDTAAALHDRLAVLGAQLIIDTLALFERGKVRSIPQDHSRASYAPLLKKADGRIDWNRSAASLAAFINGMTPWPGAFTFHETRRLKIFRARPLTGETDQPPGTVVKGFPDELRIAAGEGVLAVLEIQGASGKRLPVADFLRGYDLPPGSVLA